MPHAEVMRAIELLGADVAPVVRREVALREKRRETEQRAEAERSAAEPEGDGGEGSTPNP
jgi:hypothetical protein